jgi:hypothetical protein
MMTASIIYRVKETKRPNRTKMMETKTDRKNNRIKTTNKTQKTGRGRDKKRKNMNRTRSISFDLHITWDYLTIPILLLR